VGVVVFPVQCRLSYLAKRMAVKIVSVADIIPAADSEKENDGTPWGSTAFIASSTISKRRRDEEEEQREDAAKRRFLWVRQSSVGGGGVVG
jgi:hypothetical protein